MVNAKITIIKALSLLAQIFTNAVPTCAPHKYPATIKNYTYPPFEKSIFLRTNYPVELPGTKMQSQSTTH